MHHFILQMASYGHSSLLLKFLCLILVKQVQEELHKEDKVLLGQMRRSVLNTLEEPVDLFAYLAVDTLQPSYSARLEVRPAQVCYTVEEVMPKASVLKHLRFPVQAVFL